MSLGLVTGLLSTLVGAGGGLLANKSHRDFADYLNDQKFTMPTAMDSAESEFRNIASKGLPGKETIEDDIQSQVARSIGLGKQVADSPSALLDLLSKSNEMATSNLRQLGIQDASAQLGNRMQLAEFLSRAKAPMEAMIDDKNINLGISAERERMMGTQELIQGITGGLSGLAQGAGSHMLDKYLTDKNDILKGFYDFGNSNSSDSEVNNNVVDVAGGPSLRTKATDALLAKGIQGSISNEITPGQMNRYVNNRVPYVQSIIQRGGDVTNILNRHRNKYGNEFIDNFWGGYLNGLPNQNMQSKPFSTYPPIQTYSGDDYNKLFQQIGLF